jgi:hypothetical protein
MVVNFRAREISRGGYKLSQTPILKKKNYEYVYKKKLINQEFSHPIENVFLET